MIPLLKVNHLTLGSKSLSFSLETTKSICIVGANGSGKTTLLRTLAGLKESPDHAISWQAPFCFIGHNDWQSLSLTVEEMVSFWAAYYGHTADKAIEAFDLQPLLPQKIHYLSQGQKQRLALSRLLCGVFTVWMVDEPFAHLDQNFTTILETLFATHMNTGGALLFSDHTQEKRAFPYATQLLQTLTPS